MLNTLIRANGSEQTWGSRTSLPHKDSFPWQSVCHTRVEVKSVHPYDPAALPIGSLLLLWFLLNLLLPHFQTFPAMPRLRFSRTEDPTPRGMHTQTAVCAGVAAAAVGPGPSAWLGSGHTRLTAPSGAHFSVNQKRRHRCGSGPPSQARPFSSRGWWRVWDGGALEALAGGLRARGARRRAFTHLCVSGP